MAATGWDQRSRRNNLLCDIAAVVRSGQVVFAHSPSPVPSRGGASVRDHPTELVSWGGRLSPFAPIELCSIDPHAVQDHRDPPRKCNDGLLAAAPPGHLHGPGLQC